jgi:hypothetical protein
MRAVLALAALAALALVACGPPDGRPEPRLPRSKAAQCPPPPEPAYQAMVVGTIGKLHLAESRYPLSRLGDVLAAFKPELVLLQVRVDAFREDRLEDASFEMTYVNHVARQRGMAVEPIDWFREQDLGAEPPAVEPWDASELAKKEAAVLLQPRLFTFEQANDDAMLQKTLLASAADARNRAGDPLTSRRRAWMQELTASAVTRHGRPKRVLAFVDVFDRPAVDAVLHGVGYATPSPVELVSKAKEMMVADVPAEVVVAWKGQLNRAHAKVDKSAGAERTFWAERARVLEVALDKRGACCVAQATLLPGK